MARPLVLSALLLCIQWNNVKACGATTHITTMDRALELSKNEPFYDLLLRNVKSLVVGAPFPDFYYLCARDGDVGEHAHWYPFIKHAVEVHKKDCQFLYEKQVPSKEELLRQPQCEKDVAFLFGVISHQISDALWHGIGSSNNNGFIQNIGRKDFRCEGDLCGEAHSFADYYGEYIIAKQLPTERSYLSWDVPGEFIRKIYDKIFKTDNHIPAWQSYACSKIFFMEYIFMRSSTIVDAFYKKAKNTSPSSIITLPLDNQIGNYNDIILSIVKSWRMLYYLLTDPLPLRDFEGEDIGKEEFKQQPILHKTPPILASKGITPEQLFKESTERELKIPPKEGQLPSVRYLKTINLSGTSKKKIDNLKLNKKKKVMSYDPIGSTKACRNKYYHTLLEHHHSEALLAVHDPEEKAKNERDYGHLIKHMLVQDIPEVVEERNQLTFSMEDHFYKIFSEIKTGLQTPILQKMKIADGDSVFTLSQESLEDLKQEMENEIRQNPLYIQLTNTPEYQEFFQQNDAARTVVSAAIAQTVNDLEAKGERRKDPTLQMDTQDNLGTVSKEYSLENSSNNEDWRLKGYIHNADSCDFDGDGVADIIESFPLYSHEKCLHCGLVTINFSYYASKLRIHGLYEGEYFGQNIKCIDHNLDGHMDLLITARIEFPSEFGDVDPCLLPSRSDDVIVINYHTVKKYIQDNIASFTTDTLGDATATKPTGGKTWTVPYNAFEDTFFISNKQYNEKSIRLFVDDMNGDGKKDLLVSSSAISSTPNIFDLKNSHYMFAAGTLSIFFARPEQLFKSPDISIRYDPSLLGFGQNFCSAHFLANGRKMYTLLVSSPHTIIKTFENDKLKEYNSGVIEALFFIVNEDNSVQFHRAITLLPDYSILEEEHAYFGYACAVLDRENAVFAASNPGLNKTHVTIFDLKSTLKKCELLEYALGEESEETNVENDSETVFVDLNEVERRTCQIDVKDTLKLKSRHGGMALMSVAADEYTYSDAENVSRNAVLIISSPLDKGEAGKVEAHVIKFQGEKVVKMDLIMALRGEKPNQRKGASVGFIHRKSDTRSSITKSLREKFKGHKNESLNITLFIHSKSEHISKYTSVAFQVNMVNKH